MNSKKTFWQSIGLHDWFLKKEDTLVEAQASSLTPDGIYNYIVQKFGESINELSFADRIVFYHEYIVCFNPDDYNAFMNNKKGIFGLIIQEAVKKFYSTLEAYTTAGKTVVPASNKWVFRFASNPDYPKGDKSFIGKLLPGNTQKNQENLRVTYIPRQTGIAETFDVNPDILAGFTFYSEGYYEVPYHENFLNNSQTNANNQQVLARFEAIIPDKDYSGKKLQYFMKDNEIIVSGKEEIKDARSIFRIPSEWVNSPHLKIKQDDTKFYLASFGEKTIVNENEVAQSIESLPVWTELPMNSRIVLNGIVGINIFKS